jgi:hypothetical protein
MHSGEPKDHAVSAQDDSKPILPQLRIGRDPWVAHTLSFMYAPQGTLDPGWFSF